MTDLATYYNESYPPSIFPPSSAARADARPGDTFPNERSITASDAPNAAKLTPLGYVPIPATAWTTGQSMTVNGFAFNWTGTAWAPGVHALEAPEGTSSEAPPEEPTTYGGGAGTPPRATKARKRT